MAKYDLTTGGALPRLELDASLPTMILISNAAAQLASTRLVSELGITVKSKHGEMLIPIVCTVGTERWVPYIEPEEWNDEALSRLLTWLSVVRTTEFGDIRVQVYSREPLSPTMRSVLEVTPLARLQLQAFLRCKRGDFAANGKLLTSLMDQEFKTRWKAEPATLQTMDEFIDREFGLEAPLPALVTTMHLFGSLAGEILRRALGGRWEATQQPGFESGWALVLPGATVNPLGKAEKRFLNGPGDSLAFFYQSLRVVLNRP